MSEYGPRHNPTNAKELYNLRHSSLGVTIERAFGALKNHFRIIDNKPFHKYKTQVKLVQACCILHNWILGFGSGLQTLLLLPLLVQLSMLCSHKRWLSWHQLRMGSLMPCGNLGVLLGLSCAFHVSLLDICNKLRLPCMELVLHC